MYSLSTTIPAAPYRVLEALWYQNQLGKISEHQFQYPYLKQTQLILEDGSAFKLTLQNLTGTRLDFLVTDEEGQHSALITISAIAVNKNLTQVDLNLRQNSLNGTTKKITNWLKHVMEKVEGHYKLERNLA